ncbi:MAG TPA: hypothetical protein G4O20_01280 [Dehalococcoidia bacterium]|nr:hypothetical protein [Dehalococcoidia bacterium]
MTQENIKKGLDCRVVIIVNNNRILIALLLVVAILVGGQYYLLFTEGPGFNIESAKSKQALSIDLNAGIGSGSYLEIGYQVSAGKYDLPLRVVAIPGARPPEELKIFIYYESENDYRVYHSTQPRAIIAAGLGDILASELSLRGIKGSAIMVGDDKLQQILTEETDGILVLPAVVEYWEMIPPSLNQKELLDWISNGGTVILLGGTEYYRDLMTLYSSIVEVGPRNPLSWSAGDLNNSGLAILNPITEPDEGFVWQYEDISEAGKAAWIISTLETQRDWNTYQNLQFRMKLDDPSSVERFYLRINDSLSNFHDYYISQMVGDLGKWQDVMINLSEPSYTSETPPDLSDIKSLALVADFVTNQSGMVSFNLYCTGVNILQKVSIIPNSIANLEAENATVISEGLGLSHNLATTGPEVEIVELMGGKVLGKVTHDESPRTSIAALQLGKGSIIIFGGGVNGPYGQETISKDIMQILQSSILETRFKMVYRDYFLKGGTSIEDTLALPVAIGEPVNVFIYSTDIYHFFYRSYYLETGEPKSTIINTP